MAPISCPLCCNQTFFSHDSLKFHILNMIDIMDNLACPSCNEKCADLMDLADHLGRECINLPKTKKKNVNDQDPKKITHSSPDLTKVKTEIMETNETNYDSNTTKETLVYPEEIKDDPTMIYSCEACNVTFSSVKDHLAKFHEGEEVVLETEELVDPEKQQEENNLQDDNSSTIDDIFEESAEQHDNQKLSDASELEDEEISPVSTQYIVEDGKVRSLTSEEAANIDDKSKLIAVHSCPNCRLQFPNLEHFKKHKCKHVKKAIKKKQATVEKIAQVQKIKETFRYQCAFCQAVYTTLIALNDHSKSHLIEDDTGFVQKKKITMFLNVCEVCNTKFPTYKQLRLHSRMHKPVARREMDPPVNYDIVGEPTDDNMDSEETESEQFECQICYKTYDKRYEAAHMKSHEELEHFTCLLCNRKFESQTSLDMHKNVHSNTKKFICSYCKKPFNSYEALEEHSNKQCQKREFECQYCGRRFSKPHEKVKHERIHTGEKPHVCEVCNKSFRIGYCLTLHMRSHTGNRPYGCNQCDKRFKSYSVYNHHLKIHSEDRNYKCPFCPKAFKTAVQLAGHKNSHTKPFTCTECNRPFASLYAVRGHMETHKRENNLRHECFVCGASYARSYALRDHIKEAHPNVNPDQARNEDEMALKGLDGGNIESAESQEQVAEVEDNDCRVEVIGENEGSSFVVQLQEVVTNETVIDNNVEVMES